MIIFDQDNIHVQAPKFMLFVFILLATKKIFMHLTSHVVYDYVARFGTLQYLTQ